MVANSRVAVGSLLVAVALSVICHPRVFFGNGGGSAVFSLDGLFFRGQWIAFALALLALLISTANWLNTGRTLGATTLAVPALSSLLVVFLLFTGVPHPANAGRWRNRELGLAAFMRGQAIRAKTNAKPVLLTAAAFAGSWKSTTGAVFTFADDRITWKSDSDSGEYSAAECGNFSMRYVQKDRAILSDLGLGWSKHAGAMAEAAAIDATFAVVEVTCPRLYNLVFIRAAENEVWRWTNLLDANSITDDSFILRPVQATK